MKDLSDLLDLKLCQVWPGGCLRVCVLWRCSRDVGCGSKEYYYIGRGNPYWAAPSYKPDNDKSCACVNYAINNSRP